MTLNVYRKIGFLVGINGIALATNIGLNIILIPLYGPLGAAVGTAGTFLVHNLAKQYGLARKTEVTLAGSDTWRVYAIVAVVSAIAVYAGYGLSLSFSLRVVLFVVLSLSAVAASRNILNVEDTFPGLGRLPLIKYLVK